MDMNELYSKKFIENAGENTDYCMTLEYAVVKGENGKYGIEGKKTAAFADGNQKCSRKTALNVANSVEEAKKIIDMLIDFKVTLLTLEEVLEDSASCEYCFVDTE